MSTSKDVTININTAELVAIELAIEDCDKQIKDRLDTATEKGDREMVNILNAYRNLITSPARIAVAQIRKAYHEG